MPNNNENLITISFKKPQNSSSSLSGDFQRTHKRAFIYYFIPGVCLSQTLAEHCLCDCVCVKNVCFQTKGHNIYNKIFYRESLIKSAWSTWGIKETLSFGKLELIINYWPSYITKRWQCKWFASMWLYETGRLHSSGASYLQDFILFNHEFIRYV